MESLLQKENLEVGCICFSVSEKVFNVFGVRIGYSPWCVLQGGHLMGARCWLRRNTRNSSLQFN